MNVLRTEEAVEWVGWSQPVHRSLSSLTDTLEQTKAMRSSGTDREVAPAGQSRRRDDAARSLAGHRVHLSLCGTHQQRAGIPKSSMKPSRHCSCGGGHNGEPETNYNSTSPWMATPLQVEQAARRNNFSLSSTTSSHWPGVNQVVRLRRRFHHAFTQTQPMVDGLAVWPQMRPALSACWNAWGDREKPPPTPRGPCKKVPGPGTQEANVWTARHSSKLHPFLLPGPWPFICSWLP